MSKKLEQYLKDKRESLDVEAADDIAIWDNIRQEMADKSLHKKAAKKVVRLRIFSIAAGIMLLLSLGYIANDLINGKAKTIDITLSSISNDLGRKEHEYAALVKLKTGEISAGKISDNEVIKELFDEISRLDTVYGQARKDLRIIGPDDRIINTIFSTYEQKIRLLELIVIESNKTQNNENIKKIDL